MSVPSNGSEAGRITNSPASLTDFCVFISKVLILSIVSPKNSTLKGLSCVEGNMSNNHPLRLNSACSTTIETRLYPRLRSFCSSTSLLISKGAFNCKTLSFNSSCDHTFAFRASFEVIMESPSLKL